MSVKKKIKRGMVFYPQKYHITGDINTSYAVGVNHKNQKFVALIIPTQANQDLAAKGDTAHTIPTLADFSDTSRKARNPCFCSAENSINNPEGVLILEQIEYDKERTLSGDFEGHHVYVAKWASVLREANDSPRSPVGPGYLEVGFSKSNDPYINELMTQYNEVKRMASLNMINPLDADEQSQKLYKEIRQSQRKWFTVVMLRNNEIHRFSELSPDSIKSFAIENMTKYTKKGMYGGVIFRVLKNNNEVIGELSKSCKATFDFKNHCVKDINESANDLMKFGGSKMVREAIRNNYTIEGIPVIRINCGPRGADKYSKEFAGIDTPKLMKTFVSKDYHDDLEAHLDREHAFLFADIGVRLYEIPAHKKDAGNIIFSSVHAFSSPKGNALSIDECGESRYFFETQKRKQATQKAT